MPVPDELGSSTIQLIVVDDEKPVLDGLKRAFKPFQSQVDIVTTTSGVEALLLVSENKPHGLLIDLNMPDLDGLEVCRRVRARKPLEGVRLITMTARHGQEVVEQSLRAGAIACIAKPVDVQQVLDLFRVPIGLMAKKP
jgi:CheY-like chemotaxis protein